LANDAQPLADRQLEMLDHVAQEWTREFPLPEAEPPPLFHYTNAAGLVGIVEDQSLWASAIGHSNDLREIKCAYDIAMPQMAELSQSQDFNHPGQRRILSSLTDFIGNAEHPPQDGYSVSFCAANDLLSQWRAYGEQGGFSIEMTPLTEMNAILRAPVAIFSSEAGGRVLIRAVDYDPESQRRTFRSKLERILQLARRLSGENENREVTVLILTLAAMWLVEWIYSVKDPAFREETEWRLICLPEIRWNLVGKSTYAHPESVQTRVRASGLLPYIKLKRNNALLPIKSVMCGPAQHPGLNKKAVELLLKSNGYVCEVRNSQVPLRTYR
jgi:hypothetical protein